MRFIQNDANPRAGRRLRRLLLVVVAGLLVTACGEDPNAIGVGTGQDGLSQEARAQEYMTGVDRALQSFGSAQGAPFNRAITSGNRRQLQAASIGWDEGLATLKQQNPPKDAVQAHTRLVTAAEGLSVWNERLVRAAPNKANVQRLARQASASQPSKEFEAAVCDLVRLGYEVIDPTTCAAL